MSCANKLLGGSRKLHHIRQTVSMFELFAALGVGDKGHRCARMSPNQVAGRKCSLPSETSELSHKRHIDIDAASICGKAVHSAKSRPNSKRNPDK